MPPPNSNNGNDSTEERIEGMQSLDWNSLDIDMQALAEEIFKLLREELRIERDRTGRA